MSLLGFRGYYGFGFRSEGLGLIRAIIRSSVGSSWVTKTGLLYIQKGLFMFLEVWCFAQDCKIAAARSMSSRDMITRMSQSADRRWARSKTALSAFMPLRCANPIRMASSSLSIKQESSYLDMLMLSFACSISNAALTFREVKTPVGATRRSPM